MVTPTKGSLDAPSATVESSDIAAASRLLLHIKENNVAWMVGLLVGYQLGLMDVLFTYGSGICG